jgi:hypothetical protein
MIPQSVMLAAIVALALAWPASISRTAAPADAAVGTRPVSASSLPMVLELDEGASWSDDLDAYKLRVRVLGEWGTWVNVYFRAYVDPGQASSGPGAALLASYPWLAWEAPSHWLAGLAAGSPPLIAVQPQWDDLYSRVVDAGNPDAVREYCQPILVDPASAADLHERLWVVPAPAWVGSSPVEQRWKLLLYGYEDDATDGYHFNADKLFDRACQLQAPSNAQANACIQDPLVSTAADAGILRMDLQAIGLRMDSASHDDFLPANELGASGLTGVPAEPPRLTVSSPATLTVRLGPRVGPIIAGPPLQGVPGAAVVVPFDTFAAPVTAELVDHAGILWVIPGTFAGIAKARFVLPAGVAPGPADFVAFSNAHVRTAVAWGEGPLTIQ